ncbi:hypothetical protein VaNZ11_000550 [Volvox africanus]|uniref:rRNA methylase n=1 Tax=Volvox africanus TaxID=51714 RepID=A0ABQ5RP30_9CHLO|nr:hypothetical protein VaNZ11_000550 [Volvox africanus]
MICKQLLTRGGLVAGAPSPRCTFKALTHTSCSTRSNLRCNLNHLVAATTTTDVLPTPAATAPSPPNLQQLLSTGARLTTAAQAVWAQVLQSGDIAVDATCGNGHDTVFLAQTIGPNGHVYGFDIQDAAISSTRKRLESHLAADCRPRITLHQACHSRMQELCGSGLARVVAFNLGYLPGAGDKTVVTATQSTLAAVEAALEVVMPGGVISILAYVGHPGGKEEYEAVRRIVSELSPSYWVSSETKLLNRPTAPILILLWRRDDDLPARIRK